MTDENGTGIDLMRCRHGIPLDRGSFCEDCEARRAAVERLGPALRRALSDAIEIRQETQDARAVEVRAGHPERPGLPITPEMLAAAWLSVARYAIHCADALVEAERLVIFEAVVDDLGLDPASAAVLRRECFEGEPVWAQIPPVEDEEQDPDTQEQEDLGAPEGPERAEP